MGLRGRRWTRWIWGKGLRLGRRLGVRFSASDRVRYRVSGTRCRVPGTRYLEPGTWDRLPEWKTGTPPNSRSCLEKRTHRVYILR
jgi:hypothetical protein